MLGAQCVSKLESGPTAILRLNICFGSWSNPMKAKPPQGWQKIQDIQRWIPDMTRRMENEHLE